jgi:hypothetical protein
MIAMAHIMFDTFKFVEALIKSGRPAGQAKALMEAQRDVFAAALDSNFATKLRYQTLRKKNFKIRNSNAICYLDVRYRYRRRQCLNTQSFFLNQVK